MLLVTILMLGQCSTPTLASPTGIIGATAAAATKAVAIGSVSSGADGAMSPLVSSSVRVPHTTHPQDISPVLQLYSSRCRYQGSKGCAQITVEAIDRIQGKGSSGGDKCEVRSATMASVLRHLPHDQARWQAFYGEALQKCKWDDYVCLQKAARLLDLGPGAHNGAGGASQAGSAGRPGEGVEKVVWAIPFCSELCGARSDLLDGQLCAGVSCRKVFGGPDAICGQPVAPHPPSPPQAPEPPSPSPPPPPPSHGSNGDTSSCAASWQLALSIAAAGLASFAFL